MLLATRNVYNLVLMKNFFEESHRLMELAEIDGCLHFKKILYKRCCCADIA